MELIEKLSNIQKELNAPKNQYNKFGNFYYRNNEDILEAVKPICNKHKTTLVVSDKIEEIGGRFYVKATCTLYDWQSGQNVTATAYAREPLAKKGMDEAQITGATSSYARKYALNGLFNIDDNKDPDTNEIEEVNTKAKPVKKISTAQKDIIKSYNNDFTRTTIGNFVKTTGKSRLNDLTEEEANKVIEFLHSDKYIETLQELAKINANNNQVVQGLETAMKYAQQQNGAFK